MVLTGTLINKSDMKKIHLALLFTLLFGAAAHAASLYILYDPACMDRLEYASKNGNNSSEYIVYHVNTKPGEKVILEVGIESTTPQDFPPAQVIRCNNAVFDEKLVNAINSNIDRVFIVVNKGNNRYIISPITFAARYMRTAEYIFYDSPKYRFQFDTKFGAIGENISYKNPNTEVFFEGMMGNQCSGTLLFRQKAEFAGNPHTNIELIPEIGIAEERSGINAEDAMRNVLRLERVNGKKLDRYLRQICTGVEEAEEPETSAASGQAPEEFLVAGPRVETTTPKGEAPAVAAPSTSQASAEFHKVRKGETLYSLSKKYNISLDDLRAWNNKGKSNLIVVGEDLRVTAPASNSTMPKQEQAQPLSQPTGYSQTGARTVVAATAGSDYHRVRSGETVATIAMRYGYTEQRFREFNGLERNEVAKIGSMLKTSDCDCPQGQASPASTYSTGQTRVDAAYYNSGLASRSTELGTVGTRAGTTTATAAPEESFDNNRLGGSYSAEAYQYINTPLFLDQNRVSSTAPAQPPAVPSTQRQYSPEGEFYSVTGPRLDGTGGGNNTASSGNGLIARSFSSRAPTQSAGAIRDYSSTASSNSNRSFYVVKEGDTLYRIARLYGMTVERLREINNLGANEVIIPYQKIYLN